MIAVIIGALVLGTAAVAFINGLIPLWAVGLVSLGNFLLIALVFLTARKSEPATPRSETDRARRIGLIWPAGLVVGATIGVIEAIQKGWTSDDTIGVIISASLLVVLVFAYRKLRNKSSTP